MRGGSTRGRGRSSVTRAAKRSRTGRHAKTHVRNGALLDDRPVKPTLWRNRLRPRLPHSPPKPHLSPPRSAGAAAAVTRRNTDGSGVAMGCAGCAMHKGPVVRGPL